MLKNLRALFSGLLCVWGFGVYAQPVAQDSMQCNSMKVKLSANGLLEQVTGDGSVLARDLGVWMVNKVGTNFPVATVHHAGNRMDFSPGPGSSDPNAFGRYNKVYHVKLSTINNFVASGGPVPPEIADWPAHGNTTFSEPPNMAPFVDVNNDGQYVPADGDYPDIKGDEAMFAIFSAANGIKVMMLVYGFNTGGVEDSILYIDYKVSRVAPTPLSSCYWTFSSNIETGEMLATDVHSNAIFGYGAQGGVANPAVFGVRVLKGPKAEPFDAVDNDKDGCVDGVRNANGLCDNEDPANGIVEHYYISGSMYYELNPSSQAKAAPSSDEEYAYYVQSRWRNGNALELEDPSGFLSTANGDGFVLGGGAGAIAHFFPGTSYDSSYSFTPYTSTDWFADPSLQSEMVSLLNAGPFPLVSNEVMESTVALTWVQGNTTDYGYSKITERLRDLDSIYKNSPVRNVSLSEHTPLMDYTLYVKGAGVVQIQNGEAEPLHFELMSVDGKLLQRIEVAAAARYDLSLEAFPRGTYLLRNTEDGRVHRL